MEIEEKILQFRQIQNRLADRLPKKTRPYLDNLSISEKRAALIIGQRGTGKTTLLIRSSIEQNILYFSADHPLLGSSSLWDFAVESFKQGDKGLAIDEVHFGPNWAQQLKAIYDSYPEKKIWASDSSSLVLKKGIADLSRRFPKYKIPLLSFREFLQLSKNHELPVVDSLSDKNWHKKIKLDLPILKAFKNYLEYGLRPFFLEGDYKEKILNIAEKTIYGDIPFLLPSLKDNHLRLMNAVLGYIAQSNIPTINIESLAREWSLSKEKIYSLLSAMEHVELINIVRFKNDKKTQGKGAKIFFSDPSMYGALNGKLGNLREAFVVCVAKSSGREIFACKNEEQADFILDGSTVEVGGKNKSGKNAEILIRDDLEFEASGERNVRTRRVLPLWSLGLSW